MHPCGDGKHEAYITTFLNTCNMKQLDYTLGLFIFVMFIVQHLGLMENFEENYALARLCVLKTGRFYMLHY